MIAGAGSVCTVYLYLRVMHLKKELILQQAQYKERERDNTRLLSALETAPDAFAYYDENDRLLYFNSKYREFYKLSAQAIKKGVTFRSILEYGLEHGQYPEAFEHEGGAGGWLEERLHNHKQSHTVLEQQTSDGKWLQIQENVLPDGGVVGFRVDITRLKEREKALADNKNLFRATVEASFDGVVIIDAQGLLLEFNPAAEAMFGYQRDDVIGLNMADLIIPEEYRAAHNMGIHHFNETGEAPVACQLLELTAKRRSGEIFPVELFIAVADVGNEKLFIGYIRDITDQKKNQKKMSVALEAAQIASHTKSEFLANMSHEIRTPLNGMLGMAGLLLDTPLSERQKYLIDTVRRSGDSLLDIINDILDFSKLEAGQIKLEDSEFSIISLLEEVIELYWANAREKGLSLSCCPLSEVPDLVVGDVGRIRQILNNLVSNAIKYTEKGGVQLSVACQKQTSNTVVLNFCVKDSGVGIDAEMQEQLFDRFVQGAQMLGNSRSGVGLGLSISQELSRMMEGEISVNSTLDEGSEFTATLLLKLPQSRLKKVSPPTEMKNIKVVLVIGDPLYSQSLNQILHPIVGQVSAVSSLSMAVSALKSFSGDSENILVIEQPAEVSREKLLSDLEMLKDVAEQEFKTILFAGAEVNTLPDPESTEFWLSQPVRIQDLICSLLRASGHADLIEDYVQDDLDQTEVFTPEEGYRVLLVEDNRTNQEVTRMMLRNAGHFVDVCSNGREAVRQAENFEYDLVLMDIQMPIMDGFEACEHIRAFGGSHKDVPIIALTANVLKEHQEKCLEVGMNAFVPKPVSKSLLFKTINDVMSSAMVEVEFAPSKFPQNINKPLSLEKLNHLKDELGEEKFQEVKNIFMMELDELVLKIKQVSDISLVESFAHQLKGAAGNIGALNVAAVSEDIEQKAAAGELEDFSNLLKQLEQSYQETIKALSVI